MSDTLRLFLYPLMALVYLGVAVKEAISGHWWNVVELATIALLCLTVAGADGEIREQKETIARLRKRIRDE